MTQLTIAQYAGQVLLAGFGPSGPSARLAELASTGQLGGFVLFRRNLAGMQEIAELNARLLALAPSELPLWIAVDQEGGRVARLGAPVLRLPPMRTLGQLDDPQLTRDAARVLGQQLAALGFNLDFAPVLDVDTNPANPVIGDRSFAREPERVIRHARAFAAGLAEAGVAACGKHFPGHGDTHLDSHLALPVLAHARARLESVELAPFAALGGELPCVMTAHVVFQSIDPQRPATLSHAVVTGVLRQQLGFSGLVFSDDLEMKAVSETYGVAAAACLAIEAGCDQVLVCEHEELTFAAHAALIERATREPAFAARLREAAERSLAARRRHVRAPDPGRAVAQLMAAGAERIEERIARAQAAVP
jgi:beta-N-acetylhexosaminidase